MKTQAYFNHIQQEILDRLAAAKASVTVAVAWMTDPAIFAALCRGAAEGLVVQLLLLNDGINRERSGLDYQELTRSGGQVHFIDIKLDGGIMHHKFCVIDGSVLITGSYNWSRKARQNDENIIITEDAQALCENFLDEFEQIKGRNAPAKPEQGPNIPAIIKRLQILKNFVLLEDEEELQSQVRKVRQSENGALVSSILDALKGREYGRGLMEIDAFIQRHQQLAVYDDPQLFALQLELKACEIELNAIENELVEIEKDLREFAVMQSREVGAIIIEILNLRKLLAITPDEKDEAEKDEKDYKKTYEEHQKELVPELSEDERKQLTKQYREASMLCHPDKFQNEPDKLVLAGQLFVALNEAYKSNNAAKVQEILDQLKSPGGMLHLGKASTKKEELLRQLGLMKNKRAAALAALAKLKTSDTYAVIHSHPDKKQYFMELKAKLSFELSLLKKEVLDHEA